MRCPQLHMAKVTVPVQTGTLVGMKPMPASTHTAHDVRPYTNNSGKYVRTLQQYRSTFLAHPLRRMVLDGDDGGDGEPSVAMGAASRRRRTCGSKSALANIYSEALAVRRSICSGVAADPRRGFTDGSQRVVQTPFQAQARPDSRVTLDGER